MAGLEIKDLVEDVELDMEALKAISGGSRSGLGIHKLYQGTPRLMLGRELQISKLVAGPVGRGLSGSKRRD